MGCVKGARENKERVSVTPEVMEQIADLMAEGYSLRQACREADMPSHAAIIQAARHDPEGIGAIYQRAREDQAAFWAEEILDIADDGSNDWMERENGLVTNTEALQRSRLRVDTRKWLLSKLKPGQYGDKQTVEHTGGINMNMPDEELNRQIVEKLMAKGLTADAIRQMGYEVPEDGSDSGD